jgi:acyl-CoA synthetase (AMP-forming)/AMP-acid ligase II
MGSLGGILVCRTAFSFAEIWAGRQPAGSGGLLSFEAIVVHVVLGPAASVTEEELITWCRERLAPFKVPTAIRFTGELPRTSVGKIRKDVLRRQEPGDDAAGGEP